MKPQPDDERILDYFRKTDRIEMALWGVDGENGIRGKVSSLEKYVNEIKPQLQDLLHYAKSLEEIKKNLWRVLVVLTTTAIITLCTKFIQIKTDNETLNEVKEVKAIQESK